MRVALKPLTVTIIARNAVDTIEQSLMSVIACGNDWPILLVDDSEDELTAIRAKKIAGSQINIVKPAIHIGTGNARQTALEHIQTPYGIWLDADDQILPQRLERMFHIFQTEAVDLIFDQARLYSGETGLHIQNLDFPPFILGQNATPWLLERNWLPSLHCGFSTKFARSIGYDKEMLACEDYDFLIRALLNGGRLKFEPSHGLKYYHRKNTISRNSTHTFDATKRLFDKISNAEFLSFLDTFNLSNAARAWIILSKLQISSNKSMAAKLCQILINNTELIPAYNRPASWLGHFASATVEMNADNWHGAFEHLKKIESSLPASCDVKNNMGLCLYNLGEKDKAIDMLIQALSYNPKYSDAAYNLFNIQNLNAKLDRWTTNPMRIWNSNDIYEMPNQMDIQKP